MKLVIALSLIFISFINKLHSQEYIYKKCVMDGVSIKINGEVSISDTLLKITTNGQRSDFPIEIILKREEMIQMKLKIDKQSDTQIRFTYQPNPFDNKKEKYTLNMEIKDAFTNKLTSMIYFLIPKE